MITLTSDYIHMVGCFNGFWNPTGPRGHPVVVYNVADPANVFKDSLCKNSMISPKHSRDALAVWSFMNIIQVMGQVLLEKSWAIIEKKLETLQVPRKIPGPLITRLTMLLGQFSSVFVGRPCLRFVTVLVTSTSSPTFPSWYPFSFSFLCVLL